MLANSRLESFNCSVMTGARTEMVRRLTKLIRVARKMMPAIHHRSPWIAGSCFRGSVNMRLTLAPGLGRGSGFDAEARRGGEKRGELTAKGGTSAETAEAGGLRSGGAVMQEMDDGLRGRWGAYRARITANGVRRSYQATGQRGVPFGHQGSARTSGGAGRQCGGHHLRADSRFAEGAQGR